MAEDKKSDVIIDLRNVYKHYKMGETIVKAIDGINIRIKKGEFVAVMGPSGSGKSTSMNLIGSLDVPTKGEIYLDGQNISELDESDLAQIRGKKIGFIFQSFNLIPNLTVKENVSLPMMFQGVSKEERDAYAEEQLIKEGKTIIMVTHEPELAEAYAQIVYWLRDGKVEKVTRKKNGFNIENEEKKLIQKHPNHKKVVKK